MGSQGNCTDLREHSEDQRRLLIVLVPSHSPFRNHPVLFISPFPEVSLLSLLPLSFSLLGPLLCVITVWVKVVLSIVSGRKKCLLCIFIYLQTWP